jgi:hypothetical protein
MLQKFTFSLGFLLFFSTTCFTQTITQTIRGTVLDKDSKSPIAYVNVPMELLQTPTAHLYSQKFLLADKTSKFHLLVINHKLFQIFK